MATTLNQYTKYWLEEFKKDSIKPTSFDRLMIQYKTMQKFPISDMYIDQIRPLHLQQYVRQLTSAGYSASTIKKQFNIASAALRHAAAMHVIPASPVVDIQMPAPNSIKKPKRDVEAYDEDEQKSLLKVLNTFRLPAYAAAVFMLETGLRVGEVTAITWGDVNWRRRSLSVNKTQVLLNVRRNSYIQDGAKTHASNRTIPLSGRALEILQQMRLPEHSPGEQIFTADGNLLTYEMMRYQIRGACEEADVPYKGLHVFRHTFATNCYYKGCNVKILSKLLGHADVQVTYNTYINLYGDALEEMRSVIE